VDAGELVIASAPHSVDVEESVVGQLLARPRIVGDVVGTLLEPGHFAVPAMRTLYAALVGAYYDDDAIDALTIAERCSKTLSRSWGCEEPIAVARVRALANRAATAPEAVSHARLVKRDADYRALLALADEIRGQVLAEAAAPDELASVASQTAMQIATSTLLTHELVSFEQLGRNFIDAQRLAMAARARGQDLGVFFGLPFLDDWLRGLRPAELWFLAGEPGAGKSAVAWKAAERFAERQARFPSARRIGALVLSLEMPEDSSASRYAQSMTGIDGGKLREGRTDEADLRFITEQWRARRDLPLYHNFSSNMRMSQVRALTVEAIRRHNTGLVVIDHWKYIDTDRQYRSANDEDEAKARFLKQDLAKQLNVAVVCLAHTTKGADMRDDHRPRMGDLRGSGYVAAHADFISFVFRPYKTASAREKENGSVVRTDAEMLWEKTRHSAEGTAEFFFDASTMSIH
jgi:replicative DNA helicase